MMDSGTSSPMLRHVLVQQLMLIKRRAIKLPLAPMPSIGTKLARSAADCLPLSSTTRSNQTSEEIFLG